MLGIELGARVAGLSRGFKRFIRRPTVHADALGGVFGGGLFSRRQGLAGGQLSGPAEATAPEPSTLKASYSRTAGMEDNRIHDIWQAHCGGHAQLRRLSFADGAA